MERAVPASGSSDASGTAAWRCGPAPDAPPPPLTGTTPPPGDRPWKGSGPLISVTARTWRSRGASGLIADFAEAARDAGVQRLVLLSGRGEDGARAAEESVQTCGLEWTVLRCSWFAQNFSEHFLLGPVRRGRLLLPADGTVAEPYLDLDDLADVAADALTSDRHVGRLLEQTGPRLLILQNVAAELSAAIGRRIEFVPCTAEEFAADLATDGIPAEDALPLAGLFTEILDGRNASSTRDLARVLDRTPTDFGVYAARTAASGLWAAPVRAGLR